MTDLLPLQFLTVLPLSTHTATVIFFHGVGETAEVWKPVMKQLQASSALAHVKWILPYAPIVPVTAHEGLAMPSWFDTITMELDATEDEAGILRARRWVAEFVAAELAAGVPAGRVVLGGFSQGAALAALAALTARSRTPRGVAVLSGWLPLVQKVKAMLAPQAADVPIFWGHGKEDPVVYPALIMRSLKFLSSDLHIPEAPADTPQNGGLSFKMYDGLEHASNEQEVQDLAEWLSKVIPV